MYMVLIPNADRTYPPLVRYTLVTRTHNWSIPAPHSIMLRLQLLVLGSGELIVRDESVLVLVLVRKNVGHHLVVLVQKVLHLIAGLFAVRRHLLLQVLADLYHTEDAIDCLDFVDR